MIEVAIRLVDRCLAAGAAHAEAWIKTGATRTVSLEPGGSVSWWRGAEGGVALRALTKDGRAGFVSACGPEPSESAADLLASSVVASARVPWQGAAPARPEGRLPDGRGFGIFDPRLHAATCGDLESLLGDAATEALRADPRVRQLESASVAASSSEIWIASDTGLAGSYRQTLVHVSLGVVAGGGEGSVVLKRSRTARTLSAFSPALFGDETARLAATALEGRSPACPAASALLAPAAAAELLRLHARGIAMTPADSGERHGSAKLTVIDDGRLPGGVGTAPFDGEGVLTRRTVLIARGQRAGIVHDVESGAQAGAESTGNGVRASFRDPPRRSPTNLFIAPGSESPEDLLARMGTGLWIQMLRPVTALPREGEVAALAIGRWVENGVPGASVAGAMLALDRNDLLNGIEGVGNDLMFGCTAGSFGSPSLLIGRVDLRSA